MSNPGAKKLDITLEQNADFEWNFRLETSACSVVTVTSYGASLLIKDKLEGSTLITGTHNTYININVTSQEFEIDIPASVIAGQLEAFRNNDWRGVWEFIVHPSAASPSNDPLAVAYGTVRYRRF
jgi:hypothetical protein